MRCGRSEQIAAVEGPRDRLERVRGVRELVRIGDPRALAAGTSRPLSGPTKSALTRREAREPPVSADTRIDDREVHADAACTAACSQARCTLQHGLRRDPVGDVDDLGLAGRSA